MPPSTGCTKSSNQTPNWEHCCLKCYEYCISFRVDTSLAHSYHQINGKFSLEMQPSLCFVCPLHSIFMSHCLLRTVPVAIISFTVQPLDAWFSEMGCFLIWIARSTRKTKLMLISLQKTINANSHPCESTVPRQMSMEITKPFTKLNYFHDGNGEKYSMHAKWQSTKKVQRPWKMWIMNEILAPSNTGCKLNRLRHSRKCHVVTVQNKRS